MRFLVIWCGGSKRVAGIKAAVKLARSKSSKQHDKGGCSGANVLRIRPTLDPRRIAGEIVVRCKGKVCTRTGWMPRADPDRA